MYKKLLAIGLIFAALAMLGYYFLLVSSESTPQEERVRRVVEEVGTGEVVEVFYPTDVVEARCLDSYEITRISEAFDLSVEQARALKQEYGYNQLGFEEFCAYLITLEAESEGIDSSLAAVANNILEFGYGLIRRDELGRLELRWGI